MKKTTMKTYFILTYQVINHDNSALVPYESLNPYMKIVFESEKLLTSHAH